LAVVEALALADATGDPDDEAEALAVADPLGTLFLSDPSGPEHPATRSAAINEKYAVGFMRRVVTAAAKNS
jgi:hypothetical protein